RKILHRSKQREGKRAGGPRKRKCIFLCQWLRCTTARTCCCGTLPPVPNGRKRQKDVNGMQRSIFIVGLSINSTSTISFPPSRFDILPFLCVCFSLLKLSLSSLGLLPPLAVVALMLFC